MNAYRYILKRPGIITDIARLVGVVFFACMIVWGLCAMAVWAGQEVSKLN